MNRPVPTCGEVLESLRTCAGDTRRRLGRVFSLLEDEQESTPGSRRARPKLQATVTPGTASGTPRPASDRHPADYAFAAAAVWLLVTTHRLGLAWGLQEPTPGFAPGLLEALGFADLMRHGVTQAQAWKLLTVVPALHRLAGHADGISRALGTSLGLDPTRIHVAQLASGAPPDFDCTPSRLGSPSSSRLGRSLVLATGRNRAQPILQVTVGPLSVAEASALAGAAWLVRDARGAFSASPMLCAVGTCLLPFWLPHRWRVSVEDPLSASRWRLGLAAGRGLGSRTCLGRSTTERSE